MSCSEWNQSIERLRAIGALVIVLVLVRLFGRNAGQAGNRDAKWLPISDRMGLAFEQVPSDQYVASIDTTVEGGMIEVPPDVDWPSGTVVRGEPVESQPPTFWETFKHFDGMASDLPADLAGNM